VRRRTRLVAAAGLAAAASVAASELLNWQAARSGPGTDAPPAGGSRAIIVLGCPSRRDGRPGVMQKWRTEIAVRSRPAGAADYVLIFTGGQSRGAAVPEADVMAAYARRLGIPADRILTETKAMSTWENLRLALPMAETLDTIMIASNSVHAARARRYAAAQRPDLAGRLAVADDYHLLERWWLKAPAAAYELATVLGRRLRRPSPAP
jgi:uncharacterized SAM-binding protein YcdF (DUF218 family)